MLLCEVLHLQSRCGILKSEESYSTQTGPTSTGGKNVEVWGKPRCAGQPHYEKHATNGNGQSLPIFKLLSLNVVELITHKCLQDCSSTQPYCLAKRRAFLLLHQSMLAKVQIRMLASMISLCLVPQALNNRCQASSPTQQAEPWSCHPHSRSFAPPIVAFWPPSSARSTQPL